LLFNSFEFAVFLPLVFAIYWLVPKRFFQAQNSILLISSYIFYGWWDWRFLSLIMFSSVLDYSIGIQLGKRKGPKTRKVLLWTSIVANIGVLMFFKYYNFFAESFADAFTLFGQGFDPLRLNIILPVGISFYTFQTLSYTIDVYNKRLGPAKDPIAFFSYVSFFPQLVAGPIERALHFLPQFHRVRIFSEKASIDGLRQILWGLFKKMVIADNCASWVDLIFATPGDYSGSTLLLGGVFFAFQIYGDFSGYSDIAIGTARLFGFDLMKNFAFPYFSRDIAEFWRRWHISLSTWFRDYMYIPMGGSKGSLWTSIRNIFVIFLVSGFWHGANWTFIFWGALNALYFIPLLLTKRNRTNIGVIASGDLLPSFVDVTKISFTFLLTVIAWIFFRSPDLAYAFSYIGEIFSASIFTLPELRPINLIVLIVLFMMLEWVGREQEFGLAIIGKLSIRPLRWASYFVILGLIFYYHVEDRQFIYFQF